MFSRFRPSAAMVVACIALFVALGGTATAVSYVVSSNSQVGPDTISGHHVATGNHPNIIAGSVGSRDVADNNLTGVDINEGTLRGAELFAAVQGNGTLVPSQSSPGVTATRLSTGVYQVTYSRDVNGCAHLIAVGLSGNGGSVGPAYATVAGRAGNTKALFVTTFDKTGAPTDAPFFTEEAC